MVILLLAVIWLLAFSRAKLPAWTLVAAALIWLWPVTPGAPWITWLIFLLAAVPLNVPPLRKAWITKPLFTVFRRRLPPMSRTEREALEAGTVWWDGELFSGRPDWDKLLSLPAPGLSPKEEAFLAGPVEDLCRMLDDWRICEELRDLPPEVWRFIKEKGFFGMIIPEEHGGLGFSALAHSQVIMKIAGRSVTAAVTVMVPNSLGPAELLLHYGTEAQKDHYLPRLARGEELPCFALTGPEAGSDAASIPDTGTVCKGTFEGKEILGIRLNWEKRYITLGPVATVIGLAFRLRDPERLIGEREEPGITLALVPADLPGITIGSRHDPIGVPFQNGPNRGENVFVPLDWIIGGVAGAGQGWRMLMESLAAGRSVSLPSLSTGGGKLVARAAGAYARVRRQFGLPIGRFEGIEEALARIAGHTYLMDAARVMTCGAVDHGERPSVISAIVKYHCTERMRMVVNDGMDVLGGSGICLGPRNLLGRIYRAAPIGITVEGANILTRSMIIFGQGVIRCHPYVLKEIQAAANPDGERGLADFDRLLGNHLLFSLNNAARALFFGVTGGRPAKAPPGPMHRYYQVVTRLSAAFALAADAALLTLGGTLKRRERISGRLADILSHLYLISALLKRFEDRQWPTDELPLVRWGCEESLMNIQMSFMEIIHNLPLRPAAWLLRLFVFPLGRPFAGPGDRLDHVVAGILLEPSQVRDRLTAGLFIPAGPDEPLGRLEDALVKVIAAEPFEQKLRDAVKKGSLRKGTDAELLAAGVQAGIITGEEADIVQQAQEARREAIRVDDFPSLGK
ncbi:MAG: acyl-CoA [Geobacteraceae bacterium]|nr:MAG: acyl-CoA [Geobacteraceae bacterium]